LQRALMALTLALLVAAPAASLPAHAVAGSRVIAVRYPVAVVLYDPGGVLGGLVGRHAAVNVSLEVGGYKVVYMFNVTYVEAPGWADEELAGWLRLHGVEAPAPAWAQGCPGVGGRAVRVELGPYYGFLANLTASVARGLGLEPRWSVAVVALPGARVLWDASPYPWVKGLMLRLEGVRAYTGWERLTILDLGAVQARHPGYPMPFASRYPPVSCFTDPVLGALENPAGYVEGFVERLLAYQLANLLDSAEPWYAGRLTVDIYVVDYGGNLTGLLWSLDTGEVERLLSLLDPWVEPRVRLHVVGPREAPWGPTLNTTVDAEGHTVVDLEMNPRLVKTLEELSRREACSGAARECRVSFYWLLLPGDAYLTLGWWLNFTGLDLGAAAVATFPGYHGRVLRGGAARTVAHEAGHAMGLPHPFQRGSRVYWLLDYAYTVMSYCDSVLAAAPRDAAMTVDADKLALLHSLALLPAHEDGAAGKALKLLEEARFDEALWALLEARAAGHSGRSAVGAVGQPGWLLELVVLAVLVLVALLVSLALVTEGWRR